MEIRSQPLTLPYRDPAPPDERPMTAWEQALVATAGMAVVASVLGIVVVLLRS